LIIYDFLLNIGKERWNILLNAAYVFVTNEAKKVCFSTNIACCGAKGQIKILFEANEKFSSSGLKRRNQLLFRFDIEFYASS